MTGPKDRFAAEIGLDLPLDPVTFAASLEAFEDSGMSSDAAMQAAIELYQITMEEGCTLLAAK